MPTTETADAAYLWTARADWVDAEDGTIVAIAPGYDVSVHSSTPISCALWPARRTLIAAAPALLAALKALLAKHDDRDGLSDLWPVQAASARAAIACATMTNRTLARLSNLKTKANTPFLNWWPLFNAALEAVGQPEALYESAHGHWEIGDSPETAASYVVNS